MMNKILKPYTIIPENLYVKRSADYQLKNIIEDRGRPGYILVARQMGKTNLLLNAKKELQTSRDIISYVDLSNKFTNERECFRNIIDLTIETHSERFESVQLIIEGQRQNTKELPAHKEHERELKLILDLVDTLTIILDEVDALTSTIYSDRIFAQIRSVYFSRTNFPIFNKLTYILSGVAEPSEIIKDKNISPFNIGQKVYLEDFDREESECFFTKAGLNFSEEIKNRIFYWTNGNPRMLWEISSELEDLMSKRALSAADVDDVVRLMYVDKSDLPPLDHIKILIEANQVIRDSLISIHYGKGDALSQFEKTKLYLAGIISSDFSLGAVKIKNEILREALSLDWLQDLDRLKLNYFELGHEKMDSHNFMEAIPYFEKFLNDKKDETDERTNVANFHLAYCYYNTSNFEKSLAHYLYTHFSKEDMRALYFEKLYREGLCYLALRNYVSAIPAFEECSNESSDLRFKLKSKLNLAGCLFYFSFSKNRDKIVELNYEIVNLLNTKESLGTDERFILVNAFYNLGIIFQIEKDIKNSNKYFESAIEVNYPNTIPSILIKYSNNYSSEKRLSFLEKAAQKILDSNILPKRLSVDSQIELNEEIFHNLLIELAGMKSEKFEDLFQYALVNSYKGQSAFTFLSILIKKAYESDLINQCCELMCISQGKYNDNKPIEENHRELKFLCTFYKGSMLNFYREKYLNLVETRYHNFKLDLLDFRAFLDLISAHLNAGNFTNAFKIVQVANSLRSFADVEEFANFILIDLTEINILKQSGNLDLAITKARKSLVDLRNLPKNLTSPFLTTENIRSFENFLGAIIAEYENKNKIVKKKYGRNDWVEIRYKSNGSIKIVKYKHALDEISLGLCEITRKIDRD